MDKEKIFVIISGEYSDWQIEGFTHSEIEAIQICAKNNQDENRHDDWYYQDAKKFDGPDSTIPLRYVHRFFAEKENGKLSLRTDMEDVHFYGEEDNIGETGVRMEITRSGFAFVYVPLREFNYEKARKIAQDKIAEYNYEHRSENGQKDHKSR